MGKQNKNSNKPKKRGKSNGYSHAASSGFSAPKERIVEGDFKDMFTGALPLEKVAQVRSTLEDQPLELSFDSFETLHGLMSMGQSIEQTLLSINAPFILAPQLLADEQIYEASSAGEIGIAFYGLLEATAEPDFSRICEDMPHELLTAVMATHDEIGVGKISVRPGQSVMDSDKLNTLKTHLNKELSTSYAMGIYDGTDPMSLYKRVQDIPTALATEFNEQSAQIASGAASDQETGMNYFDRPGKRTSRNSNKDTSDANSSVDSSVLLGHGGTPSESTQSAVEEEEESDSEEEEETRRKDESDNVSEIGGSTVTTVDGASSKLAVSGSTAASKLLQNSASKKMEGFQTRTDASEKVNTVVEDEVERSFAAATKTTAENRSLALSTSQSKAMLQIQASASTFAKITSEHISTRLTKRLEFLYVRDVAYAEFLIDRAAHCGINEIEGVFENTSPTTIADRVLAQWPQSKTDRLFGYFGWSQKVFNFLMHTCVNESDLQTKCLTYLGLFQKRKPPSPELVKITLKGDAAQCCTALINLKELLDTFQNFRYMAHQYGKPVAGYESKLQTVMNSAVTNGGWGGESYPTATVERLFLSGSAYISEEITKAEALGHDLSSAKEGESKRYLALVHLHNKVCARRAKASELTAEDKAGFLETWNYETLSHALTASLAYIDEQNTNKSNGQRGSMTRSSTSTPRPNKKGKKTDGKGDKDRSKSNPDKYNNDYLEGEHRRPILVTAYQTLSLMGASALANTQPRAFVCLPHIETGNYQDDGTMLPNDYCQGQLAELRSKAKEKSKDKKSGDAFVKGKQFRICRSDSKGGDGFLNGKTHDVDQIMHVGDEWFDRMVSHACPNCKGAAFVILTNTGIPGKPMAIILNVHLLRYIRSEKRFMTAAEMSAQNLHANTKCAVYTDQPGGPPRMGPKGAEGHFFVKKLLKLRIARLREGKMSSIPKVLFDKFAEAKARMNLGNELAVYLNCQTLQTEGFTSEYPTNVSVVAATGTPYAQMAPNGLFISNSGGQSAPNGLSAAPAAALPAPPFASGGMVNSSSSSMAASASKIVPTQRELDLEQQNQKLRDLLAQANLAGTLAASASSATVEHDYVIPSDQQEALEILALANTPGSGHYHAPASIMSCIELLADEDEGAWAKAIAGRYNVHYVNSSNVHVKNDQLSVPKVKKLQ